MRINLAFWRPGKQHDRVVHGARKPEVHKPWVIRQWLFGRTEDSAIRRARRLGIPLDRLPAAMDKEPVNALKPPALPPSLATRQRERQAFRALSFKNVNENYGPEPRANRRRIAMQLAKRAYKEHRKAA